MDRMLADQNLPFMVEPIPATKLGTGVISYIRVRAAAPGNKIACVVDQPDSVALLEKGIVEAGPDSIAVFTLHVLQVPRLAAPLMLSYWDADLDKADHHTASYYCGNLSATWSFDTTLAQPNAHLGMYADATLISASLRIVDEAGLPVRYSLVAWTGEPNPPSVALDANKHELGFFDKYFYHVYTDTNGVAVIRFGSPVNSTFNVWSSGAFDSSPGTFIVFSDVGTGYATPKLAPPSIKNYNPATDGALDLDAIDGDYVDVLLPQSLVLAVNDNVVIWLNGQNAGLVQINAEQKMAAPEQENNYSVQIAKSYFITMNSANRLAYMQTDGVGNDKGTSHVFHFEAVGTVPEAKPTQKGSLQAPSLNGPFKVITAAAIKGGLQLRVPAYEGIQAGDEVMLTIYLNGYYPGTVVPKAATVPSALYRVKEDDVYAGFIVVFSESSVAGYAASSDANGTMGKFYAQYYVVGRNEYSLPLDGILLADAPSQ